ncbi:MAG: hypothetical protein R6V85_03805 [Polyangia bacterium]
MNNVVGRAGERPGAQQPLSSFSRTSSIGVGARQSNGQLAKALLVDAGQPLSQVGRHVDEARLQHLDQDLEPPARQSGLLALGTSLGEQLFPFSVSLTP